MFQYLVVLFQSLDWVDVDFDRVAVALGMVDLPVSIPRLG